MKKLLLVMLLLTASALAQSTRPVVASWTASNSPSVTGYSVYRCTVLSPALSCTPALTTPIAVVTVTTYTDPAVSVQSLYGYSVVANAPPCTNTSNVNTPCGNSAPITVTAVPVPPQVAGASNLIIVVP